MLPERKDGQVLFCPSILDADFTQLGSAVAEIEPDADLLHVDVMDGHFVPNLSVGPGVVRSLRDQTKLPIDVHLMVEEPRRFLEPFALSGADSLVVHVEADPHLYRTLQQIKEHGLSAGVAINPGTPLSALEEALPLADIILLMTVNPGYGGQSFIPSMLAKIERLRAMLDESASPAYLQIDGGIHRGNVKTLCAAGADLIVVGSAVFKAKKEPAEALRELRKCVT